MLNLLNKNGLRACLLALPLLFGISAKAEDAETTLASETLASETVAARSVASESVASEPVISKASALKEPIGTEPDTQDAEPKPEATTGEIPLAENLKNRDLGAAFRLFRPSEEISADNAVPYPVDI